MSFWFPVLKRERREKEKHEGEIRGGKRARKSKRGEKGREGINLHTLLIIKMKL